MDVAVSSRILDVGGIPQTWLGSGYEENITILNLRNPVPLIPPFKYIECDACNMSVIADESFDLVFSNSVIEHVGDLSRQKLMAEEVMRVGKKYWVQTPNKHFPIEVHFLFPFFQYLPRTLQHVVAKSWPLSYAKFFGLDPVYEAEHIWLLERPSMEMLFPGCEIISENFLLLSKSLIALKL